MAKDFDPESLCGLEEYGTSSPGIGGVIKKEPEDFRVEEKPVDLPEGGDFLFCRLEKVNLTTYEAVNRIASNLGISTSRINYAGLKDKRASTVQFVTLEGLEPGRAEFGDGRVQVQPLKKVSRPLKPGDLKGNRFRITIRDIELDREECLERLGELKEEIGGGIPNYYGLQRFGGDRSVTHLVGKRLLLRDFEGAVNTYLTETFDSDGAAEARKRLDEEGDYSAAADYFPGPLRYELKLLEKIKEVDPSDREEWIRVFRTFPRNLRRLFVHAYQSYVFNRALSKLVRQKEEIKNFPGKVPGYETNLGPSVFDNFLRETLDDDGIELEDFRFDEPKEISSRGTIRPVLISPEIEAEEISEDPKNQDLNQTVSFFLKPGRYATVVLREIMKNV